MSVNGKGPNAKPLVVLAAGGTGGHLFPAEALAGVLARRGIDVDLATDARAARYAGDFPARRLHVLPAETVRGRSPLALARTALTLGAGFLKGYRLMRSLKPAAVVGFGGYPTLPPILAARFAGFPTLIHEANAVMGRANSLLAPRVTAIATGYPDICAADPALAAKAHHTGNPVRPAVIEAAGIPFAAPAPDGPIDLLVFGGSQGARVMSEIVPPGVERLDPALRARLNIVQQAREEDIEAVRATYARLGVRAELAPFFGDLPARMAHAHLVIARSGAMTVAELGVIGRPSVLVPLPGALDQDQLANATALANGGGAVLMPQSHFTPDSFAELVTRLAADPGHLASMAADARRMGRADAAERLAELVVTIAKIDA
ncbi:UDP-N-acetylglucosamine--N-acetylmuramyl-(pentapeptide) pyrophosphoryl-undecaprenol N-acetylglucosamine transferase [Starkeya nomas]|uniref:UDP-N-acetylglucosamine--N-acetylmuramyl-(pentapeptide) pyrophosphoryl-undecaprenol N-acetylglucosamine transferase n=1 Tax=Starkeya nomas TaxID=2666134 RepID=A0A5S9PK80_9HYPH|nr:undecaprenyldiphospho-muramoylpentapeptide beta-N-acetylglucosaminyltransferase [Starkeya nomas]CAA0104709.1 UDP-N-acetylglucosamine--N-acetylmuramyl-(pentapeptide) pyrophosphoryl-undecaprenol N-acetylglucosamine transferase [Starkeya nomas]